jgi:hypothetical protein
MYTLPKCCTPECDKTVEAGVFGFVDHTHPATAQLLDNAIVRDGLADHWAAMLGVQIRQVNEPRGVGKRTSWIVLITLNFTD